jgi:hypothetical protein
MFIPTTVATSNLNAEYIKDQINQINSDPYNGSLVSIYPGIASVAKEFRSNAINDDYLRRIFDLGKYDLPFRRSEANMAYTNAESEVVRAFDVMDWFQIFALAHVPEDMWYLVDLDMYYSDDSYVATYDRACRIAYRCYKMAQDSYHVRQTLATQNTMLNTDANYIIDQTKSHDGCAQGKMEFLSGIQFIDRDLWEDDFATEYDVEVRITYSTSITVSVPGGQDAGEYINDYVGEYEFDVSYESPDDIDVVDYNES